MPIDPNKARGARLADGESSYTRDQVILYHLGLGAGVPATDPKELEYTYEKNLKVLPSFAVIPAFGSMGGIASVPGMQFNLAMLLHGEQEVIIHRPLPVEAKLKTSAHIPEIYDKGKAALVILEATASNEADGQPLFTNRFSLFIRGEGGFGGDSGPKAGNVAPDRAPDGVIERQTLPQQALIYRLSGDKNPLHADPDFAKLGGFDRQRPVDDHLLLAVQQHREVELEAGDVADPAHRAERGDHREARQHLEVLLVGVLELLRVVAGTPAPRPR